jgi:uncharacterized RDD family membrane protein YckC
VFADAVSRQIGNQSEVKTNSLAIRTPEGITFSLLLAGPVTRFLAWVIDLVCVIAITGVITSAVALLRLINPDFAVAVTILSYFVVSIGYSMFLEWFWRGQTVGKRLLRLRVVDEQGLRLQSRQIVIRNLLRFIDSLPAFYLVGGAACLLSRRAQRLGDFAANTIVVRNPKIAELDLDQLLPSKYNSFRHHPHLGARLRQHVSPQLATVALQALLRRDEFEPLARVELFRELSDVFRALVEFPQEATDGLSDEQYVRNVVDILFREREAGPKQNHAGLVAETH